MTVSKLQFVVAMILTASLVGIGVGWLPQWLGNPKRIETHPPTIAPAPVIPDASLPPVSAKTIADALQRELEFDAAGRGSRQRPSAVPEKEPVFYQGKSASYWQAAIHDRDPEFRRNAVEPLAILADADRTLLPSLLQGLKDENWEVQKEVLACLGSFKSASPEAAQDLFDCAIELKFVLPILKNIDPKGETIVPIARKALENRKLCQRAGFILLAYDNGVSLPVPLLIDALGQGEEICYYPEGLKSDSHRECRKDILAAWLLKQCGRRARRAVPALIEAFKKSWPKYDSYSPFEAYLNTDDPIDWFAAALTSVDPDGEQAIPLLMKMVQPLEKDKTDGKGSDRAQVVSQRKEHDWRRHQAVRALRHYGSQAKNAVPLLLEILKEEESKTLSSWTMVKIMNSVESTMNVEWRLHDDAVDALIEIDPKAINSREPPVARPSKRTKIAGTD